MILSIPYSTEMKCLVLRTNSDTVLNKPLCLPKIKPMPVKLNGPPGHLRWCGVGTKVFVPHPNGRILICKSDLNQIRIWRNRWKIIQCCQKRLFQAIETTLKDCVHQTVPKKSTSFESIQKHRFLKMMKRGSNLDQNPNEPHYHENFSS